MTATHRGGSRGSSPLPRADPTYTRAVSSPPRVAARGELRFSFQTCSAAGREGPDGGPDPCREDPRFAAPAEAAAAAGTGALRAPASRRRAIASSRGTKRSPGIRSRGAAGPGHSMWRRWRQRAAPLARRRAAAARRVEEDLDAEQWFALGLELEVSEADEARDAYRRALELDPTTPTRTSTWVDSWSRRTGPRRRRRTFAPWWRPTPGMPTAWFKPGDRIGGSAASQRCRQSVRASDRGGPASGGRAYFNLAAVRAGGEEGRGGYGTCSIYRRTGRR